MLLVWSFGYYSTSNLKRHKSSLLYYVEAFLERGIGVNVVERAIIDHYIFTLNIIMGLVEACMTSCCLRW